MELDYKAGNRVIAEFMGWDIELKITDDYPNIEGHYSRNLITDSWDMGMYVHLDSDDVANKRIETDTKLWDNLLNPSYGRAGQYHLKWDNLMPVVEKIESIKDSHHGHFAIHISSNSCTIQGTNLWRYINGTLAEAVYMSDPNAILNTKIESTWYNIVQFIEWYNEYKRTYPIVQSNSGE
jgi:hypothetical protein